MSDPFFARAAKAGNKRKRPDGNSKGPSAYKGKSKKQQVVGDSEIDEGGSGSDYGGNGQQADSVSEGEDDRETPAQKRLRLAKMYLENLESSNTGRAGFDAAEIDKDLIADRLQRDVLSATGKIHIRIADSLSAPSTSQIHYTASSGHRLPLTSAVASADLQWLYTASKDGSLIKWSLSTALSIPDRKIPKLVYIPKRIARNPNAKKQLKKQVKAIKKGEEGSHGHSGEILCLSLTTDGTLLASAGTDKMLGSWNVEGEKCEWIKGYKGHKDLISTLAFRSDTTQVYTASYDRTLKIHDLKSGTYVDTLFGHQERILSLSCLKNEVAVTAGGSDKTVRFWKVADESQLVFRGGGTSRMREVLEGTLAADDVEKEEVKISKKGKGKAYIEGSTECVTMVDDQTFLSGGDSGALCLWSTNKKKPVFTFPLAHGLHETHSETEGLISNPRWITSLASLPYSDLFASGSWDGHIRIWKLDQSLRYFTLLFSIPAFGFVNSLQLLQPKDGEEERKKVFLVAALGQEHRLGRWQKVREAKNVALVAELPLATRADSAIVA